MNSKNQVSHAMKEIVWQEKISLSNRVRSALIFILGFVGFLIIGFSLVYFPFSNVSIAIVFSLVFTTILTLLFGGHHLRIIGNKPIILSRNKIMIPTRRGLKNIMLKDIDSFSIPVLFEMQIVVRVIINRRDGKKHRISIPINKRGELIKALEKLNFRVVKSTDSDKFLGRAVFKNMK